MTDRAVPDCHSTRATRVSRGLTQVARWWHILHYHHPSQLVMRLVGRLHTRSTRALWNHRVRQPFRPLPMLRNHAGLASVSRHKLTQRGDDESRTNAQRILQGRFRFLNQERLLPSPLDWRLECQTEATHLWRFHLHYHEFLLDLAAEGLRSADPSWCRHAWTLVTDWIDHNRLDDRRVLDDAWHPYCISRRLPAWIHLWSASAPDPAVREQVLASMLYQARYLEAHLERDVQGNHLLENFRALALMGVFVDGPDSRRWLRKAAKGFQRELDVQILPHGEHFERSPMYHLQMLEALVEVRDATADVLPTLSDRCRRTADGMAEFLRAILHPDGQIPLLGDSCLNPDPPIAPLLARAQEGDASDAKRPASPAEANVVGDYWLHRHAQDFLLFDAGAVGPDHLPAHAHADLLSLEASIDGLRLLVDSGISSYDDDPMRRYGRSTAAHNAVQIDGADQCDMWSRFRMGYRGWPSRLATGTHAGFSWAGASHNACRRLGVPTVGRWLACRPGGPWFCIDWAQGDGQHRLTSRLHFHPEVAVELAGDEVRLQLGGRQLRLRWLTAGHVTLEEGWYSPQLGQRQQAPVLRWETSGRMPLACGWCLTWGEIEGTATLQTTPGGEPILRWVGPEFSAEFQPQFGQS
jgi:uncharacterized heparinase superfamily protein